MGRSQERELPPALCHGTIGESREGAEEKHSFRADSCRGFGLIEPDVHILAHGGQRFSFMVDSDSP